MDSAGRATLLPCMPPFRQQIAGNDQPILNVATTDVATGAPLGAPVADEHEVRPARNVD